MLAKRFVSAKNRGMGFGLKIRKKGDPLVSYLLLQA